MSGWTPGLPQCPALGVRLDAEGRRELALRPAPGQTARPFLLLHSQAAHMLALALHNPALAESWEWVPVEYVAEE